MHKNVLTLPVSLSTSSYTKDEPNFPQKKVSGVDKVVYFKDFSKTTSKIQDFLNIVKTMLVPFPWQKKGSKGWNMVPFYAQILTNFNFPITCFINQYSWSWGTNVPPVNQRGYEPKPQSLWITLRRLSYWNTSKITLTAVGSIRSQLNTVTPEELSMVEY